MGFCFEKHRKEMNGPSRCEKCQRLVKDGAGFEFYSWPDRLRVCDACKVSEGRRYPYCERSKE